MKIGVKRINRILFHSFISASYTTEKPTQLIFTCSKSTIETLEKGVKYVQS